MANHPFILASKVEAKCLIPSTVNSLKQQCCCVENKYAKKAHNVHLKVKIKAESFDNLLDAEYICVKRKEKVVLKID